MLSNQVIFSKSKFLEDCITGKPTLGSKEHEYLCMKFHSYILIKFRVNVKGHPGRLIALDTCPRNMAILDQLQQIQLLQKH